MPEYLAPGVYVEEVSFRPKTIEGVSTSTAGFVGPTRFGPTKGEPELLTSFSDFERIYGGLDRLNFSDAGEMHNYMAHAVRAFFEEGGKRLYVCRVYDDASATQSAKTLTYDSDSEAITLRARYPGEAGNVPVTFTIRLGQNILSSEPMDPSNPSGNQIPVLRGARDHDVVWMNELTSPIESPPGAEGSLYRLEHYFDDDAGHYTFKLHGGGSNNGLLVSQLTSDIDRVCILRTSVTFGASGRFGEPQTYESLSFHPEHSQALGKVCAPNPTNNRSTELYVPLEFVTDLTDLNDGWEIAEALAAQQSLLDQNSTIMEFLANEDVGDTARSFRIKLEGGTDGDRPDANAYAGEEDLTDGRKSGLLTFEDIEDISIVATPGATAGYKGSYSNDASTILRSLISHCERMRYRIAVLDAADNQLVSEVRSYRSQLDSKYAALYYPWVSVLDPITEEKINLPPSGFVTGIYARNDIENGVHKAPANEVVRMAIGFEQLLNKAQQDVLNPEGVNCFRFFKGRGYRLWGARTITSDPEWKYVNLRRYFAYLERSIDKGTQWAVFENNGHRLWDNVRRTVEDFLFNEWKSGRLMGTSPEEAYFVRCDLTTMTQNNIDNGQLICQVGVAPLRPAEFVIFRIGQKLLETRG